MNKNQTIVNLLIELDKMLKVETIQDANIREFRKLL